MASSAASNSSNSKGRSNGGSTYTRFRCGGCHALLKVRDNPSVARCPQCNCVVSLLQAQRPRAATTQASPQSLHAGASNHSSSSSSSAAASASSPSQPASPAAVASGEWNCVNCTYANVSTERECRMCGAPCPQKRSKLKASNDTRDVQEMWKCGTCGTINAMRDPSCTACTTFRTAPAGTPTPASASASASSTPEPRAAPRTRSAKRRQAAAAAAASATNGSSAGGGAGGGAGASQWSAAGAAAGSGGAAGGGGGGGGRHVAIKTTGQSTKGDDADGVEEEAQKVLHTIVSWCRTACTPFVDPDFPPSVTKAVGTIIQQRKIAGIQFLRPQELVDRRGVKGDWVVFRGTPKAVDIVQGVLGDCWFISALAVVVEREELARRLIRTPETTAHGVYQVRLCVAGKWQVITIDDTLPATSRGTILFSSARHRQLWVSLLEKALAKLLGSYAIIEAGVLSEGLRLLTGAPVTQLNLRTGKTTDDADYHAATVGSEGTGVQVDELGGPDIVWARLLSFVEANFLMGASAGVENRAATAADKSRFRSVGLMADHAYSVLQVRQEAGHRLIQLRNPWGRYSWTGDWSDASNRWTPQLREKLGAYGGSEGVFWMSLDDFVTYFRSVDIAKVRDSWTPVRRPVAPPQCGDDTVEVLEIEALEKTVLEVSAVQPGPRERKAELRRRMGVDNAAVVEYDLMNNLWDLGVCVTEYKARSKQFNIVGNSRRGLAATVNCETSMEEGKKYTAVMLSFRHLSLPPVITGEARPVCVMEVHSSLPMVVTHARRPMRFMAELLIQRTIAHATRVQEPFVNMVFYEYFEDGCGVCCVAVNRDPRHLFRVAVDNSDSVNITSSRVQKKTVDVLLPHTAQVLLVLTQAQATKGFHYRMKINFAVQRGASESHSPKLVGALHSPQAL